MLASALRQPGRERGGPMIEVGNPKSLTVPDPMPLIGKAKVISEAAAELVSPERVVPPHIHADSPDDAARAASPDRSRPGASLTLHRGVPARATSPQVQQRPTPLLSFRRDRNAAHRSALLIPGT